jgi:hypothetical protein
MRKSTAVVAAATLMIATLALAGCSSWFSSDARKPTNDAIGVANDHLKKAASFEATVTANATLLQNVAYTKAGAKDALALTSAIAAALASERAELVAAQATMDGIAKTETDEILKEYAKVESSALDARIALTDAEARLYLAFERLYKSLSGAVKNVDNQETIIAIQRMQMEVTSLAETVTNRVKDASDYRTENGLGN